MINLQDLYSLIEENFIFVLTVDDNEKIIYSSSPLRKSFFPEDLPDSEPRLVDILEPASLVSARQALENARLGNHGVHTLLTPKRSEASALPLNCKYIESTQGNIVLLYGAQIDTLNKISDWEKEERIKELSCLYSISEWIEASPSIDNFFKSLPSYLALGMRFPEEILVHLVYKQVEYGQKISGTEYISAKLIVNSKQKGQIRVGYINDAHRLLPEEQKMLSEIGRMLSGALERKELAAGISQRQEEEQDLRSHLHKLEKCVIASEAELQEQKQKLSTAESYLSRSKGSWDNASNRLETMFRAIPDQVMLIDSNLNVVMSNQEGVEPGDKCYRTYFERDTPCQDCRLNKIFQDKVPITVTMRKDDKFLQVHTLPVFNENDEVDGILEFYRDITLEKTYEQQIQQADKLASLGQLVSGIGHEINNPNQFIRGNVKIMRQALEDMIPIVDAYQKDHPDLKIARLKYSFFKEHIMTLVDDMAHGSERIKGIVDGLRVFARKDEGLLVDTVDINTLIGTTTRLVQNEVHKKADIELNLGDVIPVFAGNSQKIEQVLVNLIVNASQAIPDDRKGLVTVQTSLVDEQIIIEVSDNGKGMDEKTQRQIFDPFFTTKRTRGGTGLGLAIAFRIIEEHGGNISVNSQIDIGTTFLVKIPIPDAKKEMAETK